MSFIELSAIYISFLIVTLTIGFIKFNEKIKTKIMVILSIVYNIAIGYADVLFFSIIYLFLSNQPKGSSYEVPESDAGFNAMIGIIVLIIYICLLVPLNIFMKKKSNINMKKYIIINGIATSIGIATYCIIWKENIVTSIIIFTICILLFISDKLKSKKLVKKAGCILINLQEKEIALVCRNGKYSFPKGHLEKGESLVECAIRETKEETGHDCHLVSNKELSKIYYSNPKGENVENYFYLAIDDGITNDEIDEKDKEQTKWVKYSEVETTLSHQNLKDFWNEIKQKVNEIL